MLESLVEPVFSCGNDVGGDVPDELDKEEVVDKPGTTIATGFTCYRRRKSACWTNSWQVFPNICRSNFGEDIADLCIDLVDVQWLLALVVGGNPSDSPRKSFWASPRTWMIPCQGWSSQNLISSNKFYLSIRCGILTRLFLSSCSRSATIRVPYQTSHAAYQTYSRSVSGNIVLPNWWKFNRSKQIWSNNHSNEPNKILWLNWFVEAPFLWYFSQIVAIQHGIHPPSSVNCNSYAKVRS